MYYQRLISLCTPMIPNPTKIALETLQNLIFKSAPPRGEPFPKVPGPKKDDKVFKMIS